MLNVSNPMSIQFVVVCFSWFFAVDGLTMNKYIPSILVIAEILWMVEVQPSRQGSW